MGSACGGGGRHQLRLDTEQMSGTYGTYDRKVTLVSVPTLGEVVIERTGLTLTYLHRTGIRGSGGRKPSLR